MNKLTGTTALVVFAVGAVGVVAPARVAEVNKGLATRDVAGDRRAL